MKNSAGYRVIDRRNFAVVMAILVSIVAVGVWTSLDHVAEYKEEIEKLAITEPLEAAVLMRQLVQAFAVLNGTVLSLFAVLVVRQGLAGWRTASMPPAGSWILDGQRTWTGEPAVRIAKFKIAVGAMLGVLTVASSWVLWNLVDTVVDQSARDTCIQSHEIYEFSSGLECASMQGTPWIATVRLWPGTEIIFCYKGGWG